MSVAIDQNGSKLTLGATGPFNYTGLTITSGLVGGFLLVHVAGFTNSAGTVVSGVTWGGTAMTKLQETNDRTNTGTFTSDWILANPASGNLTAVITTTAAFGGGIGGVAHASSWSGVGSAIVSATNNGNSSTYTAAFNNSLGSATIGTYSSDSSGNTLSPTSLYSDQTNSISAANYSTANGTGTLSWSGPNPDFWFSVSIRLVAAKYLFAGTSLDSNGTTTATASFNIGAVSSPFVWVGWMGIGATANPTAATIGGQAMNLDIISTDFPAAVFSLKTSGLSGSQTVSITQAGTAFFNRVFWCWYSTINWTLNRTAQIPANASNINIAFDAQDIQFAPGWISGSTTWDYSSSTIGPSNSNRNPTDNHFLAGDWDYGGASGTNNVSNSAGNFMDAAIATYKLASTTAPSGSLMLTGVG